MIDTALPVPTKSGDARKHSSQLLIPDITLSFDCWQFAFTDLAPVLSEPYLLDILYLSLLEFEHSLSLHCTTKYTPLHILYLFLPGFKFKHSLSLRCMIVYTLLLNPICPWAFFSASAAKMSEVSSLNGVLQSACLVRVVSRNTAFMFLVSLAWLSSGRILAINISISPRLTRSRHSVDESISISNTYAHRVSIPCDKLHFTDQDLRWRSAQCQMIGGVPDRHPESTCQSISLIGNWVKQTWPKIINSNGSCSILVKPYEWQKDDYLVKYA